MDFLLQGIGYHQDDPSNRYKNRTVPVSSLLNDTGNTYWYRAQEWVTQDGQCFDYPIGYPVGYTDINGQWHNQPLPSDRQAKIGVGGAIIGRFRPGWADVGTIAAQAWEDATRDNPNWPYYPPLEDR